MQLQQNPKQLERNSSKPSQNCYVSCLNKTHTKAESSDDCCRKSSRVLVAKNESNLAQEPTIDMSSKCLISKQTKDESCQTTLVLNAESHELPLDFISNTRLML